MTANYKDIHENTKERKYEKNVKKSNATMFIA